ncbi:unnamed protein product [Rotaria sp. Silwood1]|nr:unnamed protein product [Rotaria sp. Silwood1]
MSPASDIYDHLKNNVHQQPRQIMRSNSSKLYVSSPKSNCENLHVLTKRKCIPFDEYEQSKRRNTITNRSTPDTIIHCSVSNQTYEKPIIGKSLTSQNISTSQQTNPNSYRIPATLSNSEIKSMDFRPLIINGRRKLGGMPSSSMIIIKKKSPPPMNSTSFNQKPLNRSIPVDIINSDMAMVISSTIPSSLSYSSSYSSSSSASASSVNVGTVFLPIQVTKSQNGNNNNNNNNDSIKYSTITSTKEGQRGYRYVQKQSEQQKPFACLRKGNKILLNVDVDESTKIPSSSSIPGEGNNNKSTIMMDSNVLRLIRRYDPVGSNITGIQARRSLENTRGVWSTVASKTPDSSPFLSRRSLTTTYEDEIPQRQSSIPRLQRQQAINEPEPIPSASINNSLRPILKYNTSKSRSEFIVQPHQTEPLTIEIEPHIPLINENTSTNYQPLITIGTKRVCSALSKSEWDLRLQQEQTPVRSPSPSSIVNNQQQEKEFHRITLGRSKSSMGINSTNNEEDDNIDDVDENSAPIINTGSCVQKLKQLFATKSSLDLTNNSSINNSHRHDSIDSNLSQRLNFNNKTNLTSSSVQHSPPILNSIESQQQIINKPTTIVQDVTPTSPFINKKPILKSQKTIDSPELGSRPNNSSLMPSSELSHDAYCFRRLNDHDSTTIRPRNVAKVEPYSINTNTVRPLYQSTSQPMTMTTTTTTTAPAAITTTTATVAVPLKARINFDSMGNTPTNSSTSSSAGSLGGMIRHPNVHHSDFLTPNPAYPTLSSQPLSNSASYITPRMLLSESLSHGSLHQLPSANIPSYNGRTTGLTSSTNNFQQKYPSPTQGEFHSSMHTFSPILGHDNYVPSTSYHYRPALTTVINDYQQQREKPNRSGIIEQEQQQLQDDLINSGQQQPSRRRFQKRKQMKRSKSVDLYQEPSSFMSPTIHNDLNKSYRQQKSTSREYLGGKENLSSPSSSSSSSTADIERVNRAALLRYKSLDSITFNNRKPNLNGRNKNTINNNNSNRRIVSKPAEFDFDSDDSVCGIPKPRKLCTSSRNVAKSDGKLPELSSPERDARNNTRAISVHNIGNDGTCTGITNSVRKNETINDQTYAMVDATPSITKPKTISINEKKEGEDIIQQQHHQQQPPPPPSGISLAESQFYARSSGTPLTKRHDFIDEKVNEVYSSPLADDTFHDAINDLNINKDQVMNEKVIPTDSIEEEKVVQNQELFINEPVNIDSSSLPIIKIRPLSNVVILNPFERLRTMNVRKDQYSSEEVSLQIFDQPPFFPKLIDLPRESPPKTTNLIRPLRSSVEQMFDQLNENNDSSASSSTTATTNRSIHLPVEKQRGLSEIIRKRNSRCKVEDYKRSIQKPNTYDEQQFNRSLPISKSDYELMISPNDATSSPLDLKSKYFQKAHSVELPIDIQNHNDKRAKMSIERLNLLLSNDEQVEQETISNEIDENMTVSDKRNLFETISKDTQFGGTLPRSKPFKYEDSSLASPITKKYANEKQRAYTENILLMHQNNESSSDKKTENETFDDDISKLSFKEKMTLFDKKKPMGLAPTSSLKNNRIRLTQPITAEEVQAAVNLTPSSSSQQLESTAPVNDKYHMHDTSLSLSDASFSLGNEQHVIYKYRLNDAIMSNPEESNSIISVSKRLEQLKVFDEIERNKLNKLASENSSEKPSTLTNEQKQISTSTRKTPTLKYNAKKPNTDKQHHAKTVDIVRLKADSIVKAKDSNQIVLPINKTNGTTLSKPNKNIVSVLKSDTISVLKPDDHLDEFFADASKNLNNESSSVQLNTDDLNRIAENTVRLQSQVSRVRPPRRQQQGAKNPLRQIQATIPTEDQYTEIHTNLSEQELRRLKRAQIAENAGLAQEALATLTATENFAEVNLRRIDQSPVAKFGFEPYKELMLILIKGRRQCSLRLVNPTYESINEGDCYLLITPLKVFAWFGRYANAAEKAKTTDLIDYLKQNRDFGLRNEVKYFILDQAKDDTENDSHAEFRDVLQGEHDDYKSIDYVIDDDFYEANITELNRVYRVENDLLMPLDDLCFRSLSIKILDSNEVFVFDFGSELYVWNGKYADKTKRNMGLQLAQQLWNDSYDFSECIINPFDPLDDKNEQTSQTGTKRPEWCIFGKQNQNVETLLFKGKFYDWPSYFQEVKSVLDTGNTINKPASTQRPPSIVETLKPADVYKMLVKQNNPVNMIVEQINLGRGRYWYDSIEMRGHHIQTIALNVWHVSDNERHELLKTSYGQFYSDDVYIIRWKYKLIAIGNNNTLERKTDISRDRIAYWIWQGINASPNEKGLSALMTILFNEEKGPHIHVIQEHEEATFLQLFDGTLTVHIGKRNQLKQNKSHWRLYVFLGEIDVETHWWELTVNSANLRSRTSFLLINNMENLMLLWHGYATTDEQQILASKSAMKLRERCAEEFHFDGQAEDIEFFEMEEGDEIELFWEGINERNHERKYYSLLNIRSNLKLSSTMRIFHLSSLHGPFVAQELLYPLRSPDHISPFPFTQSDLYELHQPALCLIDTDTELYIWQGWHDQSDDELGLQLFNANLLARGPRDIRFTTERRCAFRTAVDYYKTKTGSSTIDISCSIVYAGLEPIDFINLFPKWTVNMKARQQNQLDGKQLNQKDSIIDVLNELCREQYTIEELRARPLPEGVDPSKIESYLSDADFHKEFRMTKNEFYALPYWKQTNIKKPLGFF